MGEQEVRFVRNSYRVEVAALRGRANYVLLDECRECGALVADLTAHAIWHRGVTS